MNTRPTQKQVAVAAARHATAEFTTFRDWISHEDELAMEWLKDKAFVCAVDYATGEVMERLKWNKQMIATVSEHGHNVVGGIAYVIGHIVGEWVTGHTTIDRELDSWG